MRTRLINPVLMSPFAAGEESLDPADVLSTSLETLYGYAPIAHTPPTGSLFSYTVRCPVLPDTQESGPQSQKIELRIPDTHSSNWSLYASSIWVSSLFLADHLADLNLNSHRNSPNEGLEVLELGAGAGLPGILIAKSLRDVMVTLSDYPDDALIQTLAENVKHNGVAERCRVIPYMWGSDTLVLDGRSRERMPGKDSSFDVIIAADTLWNRELHTQFIHSLLCLRRTSTARIYLVAGLHTGRYTLQAFINAVGGAGFEIESAIERVVDKEVSGETQRPWSVTRADEEDERERRRWVLWMSLRWK